MVSLFTTASVLLKEPKRKLGKWDFLELPSAGHALAIRINDQPYALLVDSVIHAPVMSPALENGKIVVPTVTIFAVVPEGSEVPSGND